jgi:leucyl-tRNA synthetase
MRSLMRLLSKWVKALLAGHTPHECEHCWHVLPSQRADYHRGVSRFYVMVAPRDGFEPVA